MDAHLSIRLQQGISLPDLMIMMMIIGMLAGHIGAGYFTQSGNMAEKTPNRQQQLPSRDTEFVISHMQNTAMDDKAHGQ